MAPVLEVAGLHAGYGDARVLHGVDVGVGAGELVAVLGPNAAGKTTLLRAISGVVCEARGEVRLGGERIDALAPAARVRRGLVHVPQGRGLFADLTVEENLLLGGITARRERPGRLARVLERFPVLAERRRQAAGTLSGGEQQQLAIGRALMARPRVLLADEPSAALAPVLVEQVLEVLAALRAEGIAVLLVEQDVDRALEVADRAVVLGAGVVRHRGEAAALRSDERLRAAFVGLGGADG